jgi:hypothetical protein
MFENNKRLIIAEKQWYHRLVEGKGKSVALFQDYDRYNARNMLIICLATNDGRHLFSSFVSYNEFIEYEKNFLDSHRCFFEIILGEQPQKSHFDLDIPFDKIADSDKELFSSKLKDDLIESIIRCYKQCYSIDLILDKDILIYSSHGSKKQSYHIIVNNYAHLNNKEAEEFYKRSIVNLGDRKEFIDRAVYKSVQQFRLLGSRKFGSDRPKIFNDKWTYKDKEVITEVENHFESSLISNTFQCKLLPVIIEYKSNFNIVDINLKDDEISQIIKFVSQAIKPFVFSLAEFKNNILVLRRLSPSNCIICNRVHEHENPYISIKEMDPYISIYFNCRRSEGSCFIGNIIIDNKDNLSNINYVPESIPDIYGDKEDLFIMGDGTTLEYHLNNYLGTKNPIVYPLKQIEESTQHSLSNYSHIENSISNVSSTQHSLSNYSHVETSVSNVSSTQHSLSNYSHVETSVSNVRSFDFNVEKPNLETKKLPINSKEYIEKSIPHINYVVRNEVTTKQNIQMISDLKKDLTLPPKKVIREKKPKINYVEPKLEYGDYISGIWDYNQNIKETNLYSDIIDKADKSINPKKKTTSIYVSAFWQ